MIIYLCIKFESNTLIFSKISNGNIFQSWKRAVTPKIIGRFYPKSNLTTLYDYIHVYKISIQYTNLFKRYRTEIICVAYETDGTGRTYVRTVVILYAPHPPPHKTENGGGIKKPNYMGQCMTKTYNKTCVTSKDLDQPVHSSVWQGFSFIPLWIDPKL